MFELYLDACLLLLANSIEYIPYITVVIILLCLAWGQNHHISSLAALYFYIFADRDTSHQGGDT